MRPLTLLILHTACIGGFADPSREYAPPLEAGAPHPSVVHLPTTLGVVDTPLRDVNGLPVGVSCDTCHGPNPTQAWTATPGPPFHTEVELRHGPLTCNYCHDADRTGLRLADRSRLALTEAKTLCAQCHGEQVRDYDNGSHGGMNGYWDLRQGPRVRNHCVSCHAPHDPAYKRVRPVHPPKDRYLEAH